jgi:hypothetical protein
MQEGNNAMYRCLGYVDGAEVGVLHSPHGHSILVQQGDVGRHLAGLLGVARPGIVEREGIAFVHIPHSDRVDELLRQVIDVLITIRYAHPTLVQLQLQEPNGAAGDAP